jgi:hypothetical protein
MLPFLQKKYPPIFNGSTHLFSQGVTEIYLSKRYIFYPPINRNPFREDRLKEKRGCSLIYKSRSFSRKLFELKESLIQKNKEKKEQKLNLF